MRESEEVIGAGIRMKPKQQTASIDLVDIVKSSGRIQALARGCCGRDDLFAVETNGTKTTCKDTKEAYIFGSWKRRHKRRPTATATVRPVSIGDENYERNNNNNNNNNINNNNNQENNQDPSKRGIPISQRSSTYYPSSYTTSVTSFGIECRVDANVHCEEEYWCPRCSQRMQEPRLLPCLHPICSPCVDQLISQGVSSSSLREGCAICETPLPCFSSSPLPPPHYPLQHRLVMDAVRKRLAHQVLCCDTCPEEVQASVHCPACLRNFCSDCGTEHQDQEIRAYKVHEVRPLWEARRVRRTALCLMHPTHALRFHCIACQQVTCRECMWRGAHRGHASEGAAGAGRRAATLITAALQRARGLLNSLLVEYNSQLFSPTTLDRRHSLYNFESEQRYLDPMARVCHSRSRSTLSSHTKEARERMQEFARLQRARYLLDAISLSEELLADGADVEILSLSGIILKRLKSLGVKPVSAEKRNEDCDYTDRESQDEGARVTHAGVYHCCTFCSSGGRKEAVCACGGTMPGGYRGCGHGHAGHPGVSHWSCCGSMQRYGECLIPRKCVYQIIL